MAEIILVTGGSRSGKSSWALARAEEIPGPRLYLATCPVIDAEMEERIRRHKEERQGKGWETIEETIDLAGVIRRHGDGRTILVDCLTLWSNNLMFEREKQGALLTEQEMSGHCREVVDVCRNARGVVIFVTNEVGMGIVPENETARRFRDIAGRGNQEMAKAADRVTLLVAGIPLHIKEKK